MTSGPVIRELGTVEELEACVALQEAVWGEGFAERAPVSLLKVAGRLGGVVAGAFGEDGTLQAFVFGVTGLEDGRPVHWSDMLAVRPGLRNAGLGTRLKAYQRARCLERGIRRMYWTFDPLEARNGWLNLGKLGAVSREYVEDMYGASDSPLHQGLGTDRLVALWLLESDRVRRRLEGREPPPGPAAAADLPPAFEVEREGELPAPASFREPPAGTARTVPVPARIQEVKERDQDVARRWRRAVRVALQRSLAEGLEVAELLRTPGSVHHLLLRPRGAADGEGSGRGGAR